VISSNTELSQVVATYMPQRVSKDPRFYILGMNPAACISGAARPGARDRLLAFLGTAIERHTTLVFVPEILREVAGFIRRDHGPVAKLICHLWRLLNAQFEGALARSNSDQESWDGPIAHDALSTAVLRSQRLDV
jgi:hypothetical protein